MMRRSDPQLKNASSRISSNPSLRYTFLNSTQFFVRPIHDHLDSFGNDDVFSRITPIKCLLPNLLKPFAKYDRRQSQATFENANFLILLAALGMMISRRDLQNTKSNFSQSPPAHRRESVTVVGLEQ
jgi:hypothetical protein